MIKTSTPDTVGALRGEARALLNEFDAADGLASYYALHHADKRTTVHLYYDTTQALTGFLTVSQTGIDLFKPLLTLRVRGTNDPIPSLLNSAMIPGRPYLMVAPETMHSRLASCVTLSDAVPHRVMRLEVSRFRADMNALVVSGRDHDGNPRAEIKRGEKVMASAGVNWASPIFAEVFVRVNPEAQGRGWGRSVVKAVVVSLVNSGITPLYSVSDDNERSYDLALDVGFVDTGAREFMAQALRNGPEQADYSPSS